MFCVPEGPFLLPIDMLMFHKQEAKRSRGACHEIVLPRRSGRKLSPSQYLLEGRKSFRDGKIDADSLRRIEDAAIAEVLRMQRAIGFPILSDGELRRDAWQTGFSDAVEGFVSDARTMVWTDLRGVKTEEASFSKVVGGKLRPTRRLTGIESAFLKDHAHGPYKITMPSPLVVARQSFKPGVTDKAYRDSDALLDDILSIVVAELRALIAEGVPYIQIDEGFTGFVGDAWRANAASLGKTPEQALAESVAAENRLYDSVDRSAVTFGMHICRGNSRSRWVGSGSYDALAEQVFGGLHVDRFLLEYDSDRAGGFEALRFVPAGKVAVLGLISTKIGTLEAEDTLLRRIDEASRFAPLDRLALSPQCGFASVMEGNDITEDDQRQKLELTLRVAEKVWGKPN